MTRAQLAEQGACLPKPVASESGRPKSVPSTQLFSETGWVGAQDWARVLSRYALGVHRRAKAEHHAASPLGAWLIPALCAGAAQGRVRDELGRALGVDPKEAFAHALGLLGGPHPVVGCGIGLFGRGVADGDRLSTLRHVLPSLVAIGEIPNAAALDAWVAARSFGLIDHVPVDLDSRTAVLMLGLLATKVSWSRPFEVVSGSTLGRSSPWSLDHVLRAPIGDARHRSFIAIHERVGDLAVHLAQARGGLVVGCVLGAADVPALEILAAAHDVVIAEVHAAGSVARRSLFDLALGEGPMWTITEQEGQTSVADGREERCVALLPAWSARSVIDLDGPELGFSSAASTLADLLGLKTERSRACQGVVARYGAVGFEAGAVSALATLLRAPLGRRGRWRVAKLRFGYPFAVVAVTTTDESDPGASETTKRWQGLPVFSAWITSPEEPGAG